MKKELLIFFQSEIAFLEKIVKTENDYIPGMVKTRILRIKEVLDKIHRNMYEANVVKKAMQYNYVDFKNEESFYPAEKKYHKDPTHSDRQKRYMKKQKEMLGDYYIRRLFQKRGVKEITSEMIIEERKRRSQESFKSSVNNNL